MTVEAPLSQVQRKAIDHLRGNPGELHRWPGGYWTTEVMPEGCPFGTMPKWYIGIATVNNLARRGLLELVRRSKDPYKRRYRLAPSEKSS